MVKAISRIGNSQGLILDAALLERARLRVGDELNVEVHEGGTITLTPIRPRITAERVAEITDQVMTDYAETMRKLA